jgi:hypothetical protein
METIVTIINFLTSICWILSLVTIILGLSIEGRVYTYQLPTGIYGRVTGKMMMRNCIDKSKTKSSESAASAKRFEFFKLMKNLYVVTMILSIISLVMN